MATTRRMRCPKCGAEMNHHANKVDYSAEHDEPQAVDPVFSGVLQEVHQCPGCGNVELRHAGDGFDCARTARGRLLSHGGPS